MSPGVPPIGPLEWSDETVASLWEYYSERRPETYFTAQFGDRIVEETLRFVDHAAAVCDFGCGAGYLLERLLDLDSGILAAPWDRTVAAMTS